MQKLIVPQGIPASGKSTAMRKLALDNPTTHVIVCRDNIRRMFGKYWVPEREALVTFAENKLVEGGLNAGYTVIIDATNLNPKTIAGWQKLATAFKVEIEFIKFDTSLEECLRRDALRGEESVGEAVIKDFYYKYMVDTVPSPKLDIIVQDPNLPKALICDLDGTMCLHNGRGPFEYLKCDTDLLNKPVASIVHMFKDSSYGDKGPDRRIIYVSGREDFCREKTEAWLQVHGIFDNLLYMRKTGDHRKDVIIKKEIFDEFIKDKYYVEFCIDDRPSVCRLWKAMGLFVLNVGDGVEF